MEGLSAELDFALKSRDPYPINLESLVDLLKYKHISSLTTHLKRHFQRDIDYKKFHQVRNKRQICVYYISVDCFKQICGFCRHTQRKEIAQNLLGNMSISDVKDDMSFTDMMNDINDMRNDSDDDDDDVRMRGSSPPSKSIKIEKGNFVTKDPQSLLNRYGRTHLQNNMAMLKRGGFSETTQAPAFSNNIYNFNNLSGATTSTHITPIIPSTTPLPGKSALTSALAGAAFNPSSLTANALANAAIANTNSSVFNNNNNNMNSNFNPFLNNFTATNNNYSYNTAFTPVNSATPSGPFINYPSSNPISISSPENPTTPENFHNSHKRSSSSRTSPSQSIPSPTKPITQVTSTITPTPIVPSPTLSSSSALPITTPITPTPVISTPTPFNPSANPSTTAFSFSGTKVVTPITPTAKSPANSPALGRTTPTSKSGVTKNYGVAARNGSILSYKSNDSEFKADPEASALFDFSAIAQPELQYYDDYLYLSIHKEKHNLKVDKIYEQWEQERGGPAWQ